MIYVKVFNADKELNKLNRKKNISKYIKIGTFAFSIIAIIVSILFLTKADFTSNHEFTIIDAKVGEFSTGDLIFAYNVEGSSQKTLPDDMKDYYYLSNSCTNGVTYTVSGNNWRTGTIAGIPNNGSKCTFYFAKPTIKYYLDGELSTKDNVTGKYFNNKDDNTCTNGASIVYDTYSNSHELSNVTKINTECKLHFTTERRAVLLSNYIRDLVGTADNTSTVEINNTNLAYDGTSDKNIRYVVGGISESVSNIKNYIYYNCDDYNNQNDDTCEKWRIIGLFNNIKTSQDGNTTDSLVKIIRDDPFEEKYSWDSSDSNINGGKGVNEWSQADLMNELNNLYYNSSTGSCFYDINNSTKQCDFSLIGLKNDVTRNMIQSVIYNTSTGNGHDEVSRDYWKALQRYYSERGNYTGKNCDYNVYCNDSVQRNTTWYGKIGLMYTSDYAYAVGGTLRSTCLQKTQTSYDSSNLDCYKYNWIYKNDIYQWTITPHGGGSGSYAHDVSTVGKVISAAPASYNEIYVRPTIFLKADATISGLDDGSIDNPFHLIP